MTENKVSRATVRNLLAPLAALIVLGGCSFVQLSDAGAGVAQLGAADAVNCTDMGTVSANTRDKVVVNRSRAQVQEELIVLARNEAAGLGANAIVPLGQPENGSQQFRAYRCD